MGNRMTISYEIAGQVQSFGATWAENASEAPKTAKCTGEFTRDIGEYVASMEQAKEDRESVQKQERW